MMNPTSPWHLAVSLATSSTMLQPAVMHLMRSVCLRRRSSLCRVLVWLAISEKGISKIFFCHSNSMNKEIYAKECIRKRLLPFIEDQHSDGNCLFWPDLASCHYARDVLNTFAEEDINYVSKDRNPPCVPQLRPIEDFWGALKQKVYHHNWQGETLQQLENRVRYCLRQMDLAFVRDMMRSVKLRLRRARAYGVQSVLH